MSKQNFYTLGDICSRFNSGRSISSSQISTVGKYPVFGGNGVRGYTDTYNWRQDGRIKYAFIWQASVTHC